MSQIWERCSLIVDFSIYLIEVKIFKNRPNNKTFLSNLHKTSKKPDSPLNEEKIYFNNFHIFLPIKSHPIFYGH